jgi:hypothetical protein
LERCADVSGKADGNVILIQDSDIEKDYQRALSEGNVQKIDSLNDSIDAVIEKCKTYIFEYLEKFGQVSPMR